MNTETLLHSLIQAPKECIYCLVQESSKRVQVFYTKNFLMHVARLLQEQLAYYGDLARDISTCRLEFLDTDILSNEDGRARLTTRINEFLDKGYVLYRSVSSTHYKLEKQVIYRNSKAYFKLYVISNNGTETILGYFPHHSLLKEFVSQYYPNRVVSRIILHESALNEVRRE